MSFKKFEEKLAIPASKLRKALTAIYKYTSPAHDPQEVLWAYQAGNCVPVLHLLHHEERAVIGHSKPFN